MATEKRDGYSGIDISMKEAEGMKLTRSQCAGCENSVGFNGCIVFGKSPKEYAYVSANVPCPERKPK